jgi:hypothetical protein
VGGVWDLAFWEAGCWVPRRILDVFRAVERNMGSDDGKKPWGHV